MIRKKRVTFIIIFLLIAGLCLAGFWLFWGDKEQPSLRGAVLYDSSQGDESWGDVYSHLQQALVLDFQVEAVDVAKTYSLDNYDAVYLTSSLKDSWSNLDLEAKLVNYVEEGGSLFLLNDFYNLFAPEFIGASSFVPVQGCPVDLTFPDVGDDLREIQEIIGDFAGFYKEYKDFQRLESLDYGYGFIPSTAVSLATMGDITLYGLNNYGEGRVFFTNALLPNEYAINGFEMVSSNENQTYLSTTTASANQLLTNAFISYVAKCRDGYAVTRVFGSYGQAAMAWELHYEEIGGFQHDAAGEFSALCEAAEQIPSFTLIRNAYTWYLRGETITYLLNQGGEKESVYAMDYNEGAYSSGIHAVAGDKWLSLGEIEEGGSYFTDYPEQKIRAYPCFSSENKGENLNLYCGSAEGGIYYYQNRGYQDRWLLNEGELLKTPSGEPLATTGYSAPAVGNIDHDAVADILCGGDDGSLTLFRGEGKNAFTSQGLWLQPFSQGQALPVLGDINGDNCLDLVVGSDTGQLLLWYGVSETALVIDKPNPIDLSQLCSANNLGQWLAPAIVDLNHDGQEDLVLGTFDGYIAMLLSEGDSFGFAGYITLAEMNYKGNNNAKFGNYCVPRFADLNGDNREDIICGQQEYGLAYPIDSEYFPCREQLQDQINTMIKKNYYLGVHFYTNRYASTEREQWELAAHKKAMESYGVDLDGVGVNQHTWWTSTLGNTQTMDNIAAAGLSWNSGFTSPGSEVLPQVAPENALSLPFFYTKAQGSTMLIQNVSTIPEGKRDWWPIMAKYNMPVCVYYHCDMIYKGSEGAKTTVNTVQEFRNTYNYSFVREDQLMLASAAAYNLNLKVNREKDGSLTLTPGRKGDSGILYNRAYQEACGVKISFAEDENPATYGINADIWRRDGNDIYLGLNRQVALVKDSGEPENHIMAINIPADVTTKEGQDIVEFLDSGLLEVTVSGTAVTDDETWSVTPGEGITVFRKFGSGDTLNITYK